jgi:autotransporter-associated beta strand protein
LGAAFLLLDAPAAHAGDDYWSVTAGTWSVPASWSTTSVPSVNDTAYVANGGTATVTQTGEVCYYLSLGGTNTGTCQMSSGSLGVGVAEYIGDSNTGTFVQTGGTNGVTPFLYLGNTSGVAGIYTLNAGAVSANIEYVGYAGTGTFNQWGGTNTIDFQLYVGNATTAADTYNLYSGLLSAANQYEYVGYAGPGTFNQSGGTNVVNLLYLGNNAGATAKYNLSAGLLWAASEYVGYTSAGTLNQTGGSNAATYLSIGSQGRYQLGGGTLQVNSLLNQGVLDGTGGNGLLIAGSGSIVDLSSGTLVSPGSMSLTIGANSLVLVPSGFSTASFHSYTNPGLTHNVGLPLILTATQGFSGRGTLADHVYCYGAISAATGGINLNGGVTVSTTSSVASVNLGSGSFTVNDALSGGTAAVLSAASGYVGYSGSGTFNQSGGSTTITNTLMLGGAAGDSGTYSLNGAAMLSAATEQVALGGTGTFTQTGGTNSVGSALYLAQAPGAVANYTLSNSGSLAAPVEYVCWSGSGTLNQSGGTNTVASALYVGYTAGGSGGTYNLSSTGALSAANEYVGWQCPGTFTQSGGTNTVASPILLGYSSTGTYNLNGGVLLVPGIVSSSNGKFNLGGGTLKASASFSTSQPLTLSGSGGNGNIDTGGYAVTLSGSLSGPGGLNKSGSGALALSGTNSYRGGTTVAGGTLVFDDSFSLPGVGGMEFAGGNVVLNFGGGGGSVAASAIGPDLSPQDALSAGGAPTVSEISAGQATQTANVPEPGILQLLAAAAVWAGIAGLCRRRARLRLRGL